MVVTTVGYAMRRCHSWCVKERRMNGSGGMGWKRQWDVRCDKRNDDDRSINQFNTGIRQINPSPFLSWWMKNKPKESHYLKTNYLTKDDQQVYLTPREIGKDWYDGLHPPITVTQLPALLLSLHPIPPIAFNGSHSHTYPLIWLVNAY